MEDRLVPSTASPLTPVEFQPAIALANNQPVNRTAPSFAPALSPFAPGGGFSPFQIRTAYSINNSTATGAGQTIAIVDAYNDPTIFGDLDTFDKQFKTTASGTTLYQQYGPASSFLGVYNQNGAQVNPVNSGIPVDQTGGWEKEEALDVEWAHAIAPGAQIDLVEASSDNPIILNGNDLLTATQTAAQLPGVSVVSMSWGLQEFGGFAGLDGETSYDWIFKSPGGPHPGVTFLAATGDNSVGEWPAFSPNVIAVGGTTLTLNADNTIASETAWNTTGSGTSTQEAEPSYQEGFQSTGKRTVPDVAFDADPNTGVAVYDSFHTSSAAPPGWMKYGGTSLATPCWAGLMAMTNQQRVAAFLPTLNSTSPTEAQTLLYGLAGVAFHDITSGSVTANGHTYNAGPGYDEVTGLGTPIANVLVDDLSDTLDLVGGQGAGSPNNNYVIGTNASDGFQVSINGATESFAPGTLRIVNIDAGAGTNTVQVNATPASVLLYIDNTAPGHNDSVVIGSSGASLSNVEGSVIVQDAGGTTALTVDGTGDSTGRAYTVFNSQVRVSGMVGVVDYYDGGGIFGDVSSLTINGGPGNNTYSLGRAGVPLTINAGSGTNHVDLAASDSAVNITGYGTNYVTVGKAFITRYGTNYVTVGNGSLTDIAGPVNIGTSNSSGHGDSYVTLDDTTDTTGRNYTITSSSIAVQGGPTINLSGDVAGVTINDSYKANSYTVESVLATDPVTINGDPLDVVSGPAAGQVTFNKNAHGVR
jgi:hypothetical protein